MNRWRSIRVRDPGVATVTGPPVRDLGRPTEAEPGVGLRIHRDVLDRPELSLERHVVLGPELPNELDALDQSATTLRKRHAGGIELADTAADSYPEVELVCAGGEGPGLLGDVHRVEERQ